MYNHRDHEEWSPFKSIFTAHLILGYCGASKNAQLFFRRPCLDNELRRKKQLLGALSLDDSLSQLYLNAGVSIACIKIKPRRQCLVELLHMRNWIDSKLSVKMLIH